MIKRHFLEFEKPLEEIADKIDPDFWGGESKVKLKILKDSTEALISLNDNFMIDLNSENLDNLRSIFGDNKIKLS